jgi:hypothetical protein
MPKGTRYPNTPNANREREATANRAYFSANKSTAKPKTNAPVERNDDQRYSPDGNPFSVPGAVDSIKKRKKLLDET